MVVAVGISLSAPASAADLTAPEAFIHTLAWLEANQNADGSWGSGPTAALVTAEALNALARTDRVGAPAAQKAIAWLRAREYASLDYRARAVRALVAAGQDVEDEGKALKNLDVPASPGFGPAGRDGVTAYDTALVSAAVLAAGTTFSGGQAGTPNVVPAGAF